MKIAGEYKFSLPEVPDSNALEEFLVKQKAADPVRFPDLSLTVIKLLGAGEYVAELPDGNVPGHFGLGSQRLCSFDSSKSPLSRPADTTLVESRARKGSLFPIAKDELDVLATHCTEAEDAAKKVERHVEKSAAALLLESRIGEKFDAIVTGASEKGTWVRLLSMPVEGKLVKGFEGLDVGETVRVKLIDTNVEQGYIDFKKIGSSKHG